MRYANIDGVLVNCAGHMTQNPVAMNKAGRKAVAKVDRDLTDVASHVITSPVEDTTGLNTTIAHEQVLRGSCWLTWPERVTRRSLAIYKGWLSSPRGNEERSYERTRFSLKWKCE